MASTRTKKKPARTAPTSTSDVVSQEDAGGNVDKIRDILFGGQMRDYEKRFARLEERLHKENADLRTQLEQRVNDLEAYTKKEFDAAVARLGDETSERAQAVKEVLKELRDTAKALEKRLTQLDDRQAKSDKALRDQLLEQSKSFAAQLRERADELSQTIERGTSELRTELVDKAVLADLFSEMALRVADEFELPGES